MASFERKINESGTVESFILRTQSIPLAGLVPLLRMVAGDNLDVDPAYSYRYSLYGAIDGEPIHPITTENLFNLTKKTDTYDLIIEVFVPVVKFDAVTPASDNSVYGRSMFRQFFYREDLDIVGWAWNVLEKLFVPGIVPMYISREDAEDYNAFFLAITHFFAFIVMYARRFRKIEESEMMLRLFLEAWGIVYDTIDTQEERTYLFQNWIREFDKRGTQQVAYTGEQAADFAEQITGVRPTGVPHGEARRVVGYDKPSEFIYAVLNTSDVGWCVGHSSPTWWGTDTVNAVSKGWDYGYAFSIDSDRFDTISLESYEVDLEAGGGSIENKIYTVHDWVIEVGTGDEVSLPKYGYAGVAPIDEYPIVGREHIQRTFSRGKYVFQTDGKGYTGISSEESGIEKAFEVYAGMDYEVTVWVKTLEPEKVLDAVTGLMPEAGKQNIKFGVYGYALTGDKIQQVELNTLFPSDSFYSTVDDEGEFQSPCQVANTYYMLKGIIYNVLAEKPLEEEGGNLYSNFLNGTPLKFANGTVYLAPYLVQQGDGETVPLEIGGITFKPLYLFPKYHTTNYSLNEQPPKLMPDYPAQQHSWVNGADNTMSTTISPVGQGYLGSKYVVDMYSQVNSARTKADIEKFMRDYLISYKDVFVGAWLDFLFRSSFYLTFEVRKAVDDKPIRNAFAQVIWQQRDGSTVRQDGRTNKSGVIRFEIEQNTDVQWRVTDVSGVSQPAEAGAYRTTRIGKADVLEIVHLNIPIVVNFTYWGYDDEGSGTVLEEHSDWGKAYFTNAKAPGDKTYLPVPGTTLLLVAEPAEGYDFKKWIIKNTGEEFDYNHADYYITGFEDPLEIQAVFELATKFQIFPKVVEIDPYGGSGEVLVNSTKTWEFDPIPEDWATVEPMGGGAGNVKVVINVEGDPNLTEFESKVTEDTDVYEVFQPVNSLTGENENMLVSQEATKSKNKTRKSRKK